MLVYLLASTSARPQEQMDSIILSVSPKTVRWADVYKGAGSRLADPYFHVRVFEKDKGTPPWAFRERAPHLVVTPEALAASRTKQHAKIYAYKDVEFRIAYRHWLEDPTVRARTPVCITDILSCLRR
ncbi:DUF5086 family protein [Rhizobium esperanzae]|uniref:DUF5086 domain-containing protein n=1 Tax=Rhizobium esperanzae TaxID=1967781 RepID=A0A7W6R6Y9_9HYPH|nr:hypothetical protein [Rhizobium esperanzae]